jgi:hypothetical protein
MHSTMRHDTNYGRYSTIDLHTANLAQYDTMRYDTIWTTSDRPTIQYIHVRQTLHSTYDPRFVLYFFGEFSTERYDMNCERYNTIYMANPAQYDTTRYEPRVIGLQYNTYMYGKPRTVHMIRGSYCICSGSTVRYESMRTARMPVANWEILYTIREILFTIREIFFYAPRFFTIRSAVRTVFPRCVIRSYFIF